MNNSKEIHDVLAVLDRLEPLVDQAERQFASARNWGFLDMLGGGFIVDMIKHYKLNNARSTMEEINWNLRELERELKDVVIPVDFRMQMGGFSTFADFFFDGILADTYMQSKILSSLNQVRELRNRLNVLKNRMRQMLNQ